MLINLPRQESFSRIKKMNIEISPNFFTFELFELLNYKEMFEITYLIKLESSTFKSLS